MTADFRLLPCREGAHSDTPGPDAALAIAARTLPEENASTAILRKPGFRLDGTTVHPEDGVIREWRP